MKSIIFVFMLFASMSTFANTSTLTSIPELDAQVDVARVAQATVLGSNVNKDITLRLITVDSGLSTDVSMRYKVILTFFHAGEMNNTRTSFDLGGSLILPLAKRISAGVYEVKIQTLDEETYEIKNKTLQVNTAQVFVDDRNLKLEDFADSYFKSTVVVTEK